MASKRAKRAARRRNKSRVAQFRRKFDDDGSLMVIEVAWNPTHKAKPPITLADEYAKAMSVLNRYRSDTVFHKTRTKAGRPTAPVRFDLIHHSHDYGQGLEPARKKQRSRLKVGETRRKSHRAETREELIARLKALNATLSTERFVPEGMGAWIQPSV